VIESRNKVRPIAVADVSDFKLTSGADFDPERLIGSSCWSLYSIDPSKNQAVFVELPETTNLAEVPFAYAAQFEDAVSVAIVPLEVFVKLSTQIHSSASLTMLYSTGRCGSTLASRILAQIPDVWSISEPDCLTNLTLARLTVPEVKMAALLAAARRYICHSAADTANVVIKPRSEQVFQIVEFSRSNPDANNVFMYRDALGYVRSMFRLAQRATGNPEFLADPNARQLGWFFASAQAPAAAASRYLREGQTEFDNLEAIVLAWVLRIRAAEEASATGIPIEFLHYGDLTANRRETTGRLLSACGLDKANVELGLKGFDRDAHAGRATENKVPTIDLDELQTADVSNLLHRWQQCAFLNNRL
jgi:hypothetical protein